MSAPLSFQLNLTGNFAAQLAPVNAGLAATDKGTHKAAAGVRLFEAELGKGIASVGGFSVSLAGLGGKGALLTFDLAEGIRGGVEAVSSLIEKFVDLGKEMLKVAGAAQDLDLAERLNLGDKGAKGVREVAESLGATRHDDDAIRRALLPVERAGLKDPDWLRRIAIAGADIEAATAGEIKMADAVHRLGMVATKREINSKLISDLGLNASDAYNNLAELLHTTPEAAKKAASEGKVAGLTLVSVLLDEMQKKQGGTIGRGAFEGGQTMGATLQRLHDLPENMFRQLADAPVMKGLQLALEDFIKEMKGPTGASVMQALAEALRAAVPAMELLAKGLTYFLGGSQEEINKQALNAAGVPLDVGGGRKIRMDAGDVRAALKRAGLGGNQIGDLFAIYGEEAAKKVAIAQVTKELGGQVGEGFLAGINAKVPMVGAGAGALADAAVGGVKKPLKIQSPSMVFHDLGGQVGEGFARGIEGSKDRVGRAYGLLGDVSIPGGAPGVGGAGAGMSILWTGNVVVQSASASAPDVGEAAALAVRREFRLILDEVGARRGGRP